MRTNEKIYDSIIIGAGMSGISAAKYLSEKGYSAKILDKGKAPGGRIASKRIKFANGTSMFDYGCRSITSSSFEFNKELVALADKNIIKKFENGSQKQISDPKSNNPRIIGNESMRSIILELASGLNISNETKIERVFWCGDYWQVVGNNENIYFGHNLILTMPIPQTLHLLSNSEIKLEDQIKKKLENIEYLKTIVGLFVLNSESKLNTIEKRIKKGPISVITNNNLKGVNNYKHAVTIEMTNKYSTENWDRTDDEILQDIRTLSREWLGSNIIKESLHKWKYSSPIYQYHKKYEFISSPGPIYLAGDVFSGTNAESAYLSGRSAAKSLMNKLQINEEMADR